MAELHLYKEIGQVPQPYQPNAMYAVRAGDGIDLYVANSTGTQIHKHNNTLLVWDYLAANWSVEPTELATISEGVVWEYTLDSTTRYRLVPTPYDATEDAFYADFDGTNLTNLIVTRG